MLGPSHKPSAAALLLTCFVRIMYTAAELLICPNYQCNQEGLSRGSESYAEATAYVPVESRKSWITNDDLAVNMLRRTTCYSDPTKKQLTFSALRNQREMIRHRHILISGFASNRNIEIPVDGRHSQFDLHCRYSPPETCPCSLPEERYLVTHGLIGSLVNSEPALRVEAIRIWKDCGVTLLGEGLAGHDHLRIWSATIVSSARRVQSFVCGIADRRKTRSNIHYRERRHHR